MTQESICAGIDVAKDRLGYGPSTLGHSPDCGLRRGRDPRPGIGVAIP